LEVVGWFGLLTYPVYLLHQDLGLMALESLRPQSSHHFAQAVTTTAVIIAAVAVLALEKTLSPILKNVAGRLIFTMAKRVSNEP
jgi:peptidoglycan/LPS O-acetylase OafA/YrhL